MARKREKRKFVDVNKLTAEDRAIEEKAYGELGPSFDDPMWVEKAQDWYMVCYRQETDVWLHLIKLTRCNHKSVYSQPTSSFLHQNYHSHHSYIIWSTMEQFAFQP